MLNDSNGKTISLSPPYTSTFDCGRLLAGLNGIRSHTVCHRCSNPQEAIVPKSQGSLSSKTRVRTKAAKISTVSHFQDGNAELH